MIEQFLRAHISQSKFNKASSNASETNDVQCTESFGSTKIAFIQLIALTCGKSNSS